MSAPPYDPSLTEIDSVWSDDGGVTWSQNKAALGWDAIGLHVLSPSVVVGPGQTIFTYQIIDDVTEASVWRFQDRLHGGKWSDEVDLTFDTDYERAKELMVAAASETTPDIISETGQSPFIRVEFLEWGILVRLRYNTVPMRRQEISTDIIERLLVKFRKEYPRVKFAIPATNIRYRPEETGEGDAVEIA